MDPGSPVSAIVAERDGLVIGMANYIIHDNTATLTPVCYLQDLFVDPGERAHGVGKQWIDWLVAEMGRQPWVVYELMPTIAAVSRLKPGAVQVTFWIFLVTFSALFIAEIRIMLSQIKKGPGGK